MPSYGGRESLMGEIESLMGEITTTAGTSSSAGKQRFALHAGPQNDILSVETVSSATSIVRTTSQWYVHVGKRLHTSVTAVAL